MPNEAFLLIWFSGLAAWVWGLPVCGAKNVGCLQVFKYGPKILFAGEVSGNFSSLSHIGTRVLRRVPGLQGLEFLNLVARVIRAVRILHRLSLPLDFKKSTLLKTGSELSET